MAVRTLGVFSGSMHLDAGFLYFWCPASGASPFKVWWLYYVVVRWDFWGKTSLGSIEELDVQGEASLEKSEVSGDDGGVAMEEVKGVRWRDAALRLAYVHAVNSIVHVVWLRHFWKFGEGEPCTRYVNNSEIMAVVLAGEVAGYIVWRLLSRNRVERGVA